MAGWERGAEDVAWDLACGYRLRLGGPGCVAELLGGADGVFGVASPVAFGCAG